MPKFTDADRQFSADFTLLGQGHYKEWFYQGMDEWGKTYLRQPARTPEPVKPDNYLINFENTQVKGWEQKAACAGVDPVVFFSESHYSKEAYLKPDAEWRKYCPQCPVRETCLQAARESGSVGIWGGKLFHLDSGGRAQIFEFDDETMPKRGRPRKDAKTSAQRSKEYRDRIRATKAH